MIATEENQHELDEIKADTEALEVGEFPQNPGMETLCKYLRQRQRFTSERERIKEQCEALLRTLDNNLKNLDFVYLPVITPIVRGLLEGQKLKSIKTPWGNAGFRTQPANLFITDETKLMAAADTSESMRGLIVVERSIPKSALNQYVKETGELPAGVEMAPARERFFAE